MVNLLLRRKLAQKTILSSGNRFCTTLPGPFTAPELGGRPGAWDVPLAPSGLGNTAELGRALSLGR